MTIGKRKGFTAKGVGAAPGNDANKKVGGSLSKNDHWYIEQAFGMLVDPGAAPVPYKGHTATGGIVHDYIESGVAYRVHVFNTSGSFVVTELSSAYPAEVDYLLVGGGGAGGNDTGAGWSGGGGAGAVITNVGTNGGGQSLDPAYTISATTYPVAIAAGGGVSIQDSASGFNPGPSPSEDGNGGNTTFLGKTANGGGKGGENTLGGHDTPGNGSGGGGGYSCPPTGAGDGGTYGHHGGVIAPGGSGGGGAGGRGYSPNSPTAGPNNYAGGKGVQSPIGGPGTVSRGVIGVENPYPGDGGPSWGWVGGGGGGKYGGTTAPERLLQSGEQNCGGGGGGSGGGGGGGYGGSGLAAVRYKIGEILSYTAKATGGAINFYENPGGTTYAVHAFLHSGRFENTSGSPLTIEHVMIGGGGGGGFQRGGGGGAGALRTSTDMLPSPQRDSNITVSTGAPNALICTIGAGGKGGSASPFYQNAFNGYLSSITCPGNPLAPHVSGPFTANGGGAGASDNPSPTTNGYDGGSGGGATNPGSGGSGTQGTGATGGWGKDGGAASGTTPHYGAGGGGGIGGAGGAGSGPEAGDGGVGLQLPLIFRDPKSSYGAPGPSGTHWMGGGGGGGYYKNPPTSPYVGGKGGGAAPPTSSWSGAGDSSYGQHFTGGRGMPATGSGGGAGMCDNTSSSLQSGGAGGSGLILIAYTL